jgi:hypothetical protein
MMKIKTLLVLFATVLLTFDANAFELITAQGGGVESTFEWSPSRFPVRYFIHNAGTTDIGGTAERNQLIQGLTRWNPVSPLKFQFAGTTATVTGGDQINAIIFDRANFGAGSSTLAFCEAFFFTSAPGTRIEGDIHFNNRDFRWTMGASNPNNDVYKILPVAVHEVGHSVGIGHSAVPIATMFFSAQAGDIGQTLDIDDTSAAKFLYGPRQNTLTVPKLISPLNNTSHRVLVGTGTQAAAGITFRWEQNNTLSLTSFVLEVAGNAAMTQGIRRFNNANRLAIFMGPGARLNALKTIQRNSPEGKVFWRVSAKAGAATVRSAVQSITLVQ